MRAGGDGRSQLSAARRTFNLQPPLWAGAVVVGAVVEAGGDALAGGVERALDPPRRAEAADPPADRLDRVALPVPVDDARQAVAVVRRAELDVRGRREPVAGAGDAAADGAAALAL